MNSLTIQRLLKNWWVIMSGRFLEQTSSMKRKWRVKSMKNGLTLKTWVYHQRNKRRRRKRRRSSNLIPQLTSKNKSQKQTLTSQTHRKRMPLRKPYPRSSPTIKPVLTSLKTSRKPSLKPPSTERKTSGSSNPPRAQEVEVLFLCATSSSCKRSSTRKSTSLLHRST